MGSDSIWHGDVEKDASAWDISRPFEGGIESAQELMEFRNPSAVASYLAEVGSDYKFPANPTIREMALGAGAVMRGVSALNQASAGRQALGEVGQAVGFLSRDFTAISTALSAPTSAAMKAATVSITALQSEYVSQALDAIGAVPVVGYIVDIVAAVAQLVTGAVQEGLDAQEARAVRAIQQTYAIPVQSSDENLDQSRCRGLFRKIRDAGKGTDIVRPRFLAPSMDHLMVHGVYDPINDKRPVGMRIQGGGEGGFVEGEGFVPGTATLHDNIMYLYPNTGSRIRDAGSLYPTAQSVAGQWWAVVTKAGPALYTVDTRNAIDEWSDLIESLFALAISMESGWAAFPQADAGQNTTGIIPVGATEYQCSPANKNITGCGVNTNWYTIPSDFRGGQAVGPFATFLARRFFSVDRAYNLPSIKRHTMDRTKFINIGTEKYSKWMPRPSNLDIEKSVPVRALRNLRERQEFALESMNAFYVNGEDRETFEAFRSSSLRAKWREAIVNLLNHGDWKKVVYADMPEGPAKNHVREKIVGIGEDPETFNMKPSGPSGMAVGSDVWKSSLSEPKLPEPPQHLVSSAEFIDPDAIRPKRSSSKPGGGKSGGGGTAVLAAAAAGAFILAKRK